MHQYHLQQPQYPPMPPPVLNLYMRLGPDTLPSPTTTDAINDVERVRNMMHQEDEEYRCDDYLARQNEEQTMLLRFNESRDGSAGNRERDNAQDSVMSDGSRDAEEENSNIGLASSVNCRCRLHRAAGCTCYSHWGTCPLEETVDENATAPATTAIGPRPISPTNGPKSSVTVSTTSTVSPASTCLRLDHQRQDSTLSIEERQLLSFPCSTSSAPAPALMITRSEFLVDAVCREKMCEWSYRVCDHFGASRDIVAVSFSYLDRFVERHACCDRSTFKLAAMVTLYLASKVYHAHPLTTVSNLAELSRGEFTSQHILAMEEMLLHSLEWRLHPPTAQCFVSALSVAVPESLSPAFAPGAVPSPSSPSMNIDSSAVAVGHSSSLRSAICSRAVFFAELCLYDYTFVTCERSLIAIAAVLNAMEGLGESSASLAQQSSFLHAARVSFGIEYDRDAIEQTRNRLWYVYSLSAQYVEDVAPAPVQLPCPSSEYGSSSSSASADELYGKHVEDAASHHRYCHHVQRQSPVCVVSKCY